jgi:hypothetical protein
MTTIDTFNKKINILRVQLFDNIRTINPFAIVSTYDKSSNERVDVTVTVEEANDMIESWIGKVKIDKTFYKPLVD